MSEYQPSGYLDYSNGEARVRAVEEVRQRLPEIIAAGNNSLDLLNTLHFESTHNTISSPNPLMYRANSAQVAMLAADVLDAKSPLTYDPASVLGIASQLEVMDVLKIYPFTRGETRKAASIKKFNKREQRFEDHPVDIYSQQSLRVDENYDYLTSIFDVNKLIDKAAKAYDQDKLNAQTDADFSKALARFWFTGISMIHPYIDGNARAFELFLEAEFLRKGLHLDLPKDERGKLARTNPVPGQELDQQYNIEFAKRYNIQLHPHNVTYYPPNLFSDYYPNLNKKIMDGINDVGNRGNVEEIEKRFADLLSNLVK